MAVYVAVFALVMAYVAVVAAYLALRTLAKLRRATTVLARDDSGASLLETTQLATERTAIIGAEIADLRAMVADGLAERRDTKPPSGLGNIALVRYDAFGEMSGRMSFSLALLDEHGDGVTISAIAGRSDTRVYAKGVADGKGEHDLSPEEQQAVSAAMAKRRSLLRRSA